MKYNPKIRLADYKIVAEITGMSYVMVKAVAYGYRNNTKIKKAIEEFTERRDAVIEDLKDKYQPFV